MYNEYKKLLAEYVSFKSISTDKKFEGEMVKTAKWLQNIFNKNGFKTQLLKGPKTNQVVFASYVVDPKAETVLVYGHYDVQPAEKKDGWKSEPFTLTESKGKLYARGVVDNKGQNLIHVFTVLDLIKKENLKYNVKFLIEGNEETSNPDIAKLVEKNKKLLKADHIIVSDGEIAGDKPTIEVSLRGGGNIKVILTTGKNNLHSGLCGGAAPSASHELAHLLSKLFGKKNDIAIPGFYENVATISTQTKKQNKGISLEKEILDLLGVSVLLCEPNHDFYTQVGLRPTIQITGIKTGYIDEGFSNIVPCTAEARLNIRLVANQDPKKVLKYIKEFLIKNTPKYVQLKIESEETLNDPAKIDIDKPIFKVVRKMMKDSYGYDPIIKYVGGGIPIVSDFQKILGVDPILASLGNEDCNMHGVDENYTVSLVKKGLDFSNRFFSKK